MNHIIFASYGNDSLALIRWAADSRLSDVVVAYSDTGWAADGWSERVADAEAWVHELGFGTVRLKSEGMADLIRRKKAFPRGGGKKIPMVHRSAETDTRY